jgi:hypothetical protein
MMSATDMAEMDTAVVKVEVDNDASNHNVSMVIESISNINHNLSAASDEYPEEMDIESTDIYKEVVNIISIGDSLSVVTSPESQIATSGCTCLHSVSSPGINENFVIEQTTVSSPWIDENLLGQTTRTSPGIDENLIGQTAVSSPGIDENLIGPTTVSSPAINENFLIGQTNFYAEDKKPNVDVGFVLDQISPSVHSVKQEGHLIKTDVDEAFDENKLQNVDTLVESLVKGGSQLSEMTAQVPLREDVDEFVVVQGNDTEYAERMKDFMKEHEVDPYGVGADFEVII